MTDGKTMAKPSTFNLEKLMADYAEAEEKFIKGYPWLLRPLVRWVRRATIENILPPI